VLRVRSGSLLGVAAAVIAGLVGTLLWATATEPLADEQATVESPPALSRSAPSEVVPAATLDTEAPAVVRPLPPEPLLQPAALEVTVVDVRDQLVADARVDVWEVPDLQVRMRRVLTSASIDELAKLDDDGKLQRVVELVAQVEDPSWDPPRVSLRTDSEGRCIVPDATGETILAAVNDGVGTPGTCEAVPERITLKLRPSARVHGIVRDAEGRPISGATVRFGISSVLLERAGPRTPRPVLSDGEGQFEVAVDAGALGDACAYVGMPERASVKVMFSVEAGEDEELEIFFADGTISGRVTWDDGEPVQRCAVTARLLTDLDGRNRDDQDRRVTAGPDGTFRITGLRLGARYSVQALAMAPAGVWAERDDVETGESDLVLVLSKKDAAGWTLRGRVTDMTTGGPIKAFEIGITNWSDAHLGRAPMRIMTKHDTQDGRFEVPRLPAKWDVAVQVRADGYEPAIFGPIWQDEWSERTFEIGHSGTLTVEVAGPGGQLLEGVRVLLYDEVSIDGFDLGRPERDEQTPKAGRLSWLSLKPGRRWLLAEHAQGRAGPTRVAVPSGGEDVVRCQLVTETPKGRLRVVVRDAENRRLQGEEIELERQASAPREGGGSDLTVSSRAQTGPSGEGLVDGLLPGVYRVWVVADHWSSMRFVCVEPGGTTGVEFRTERR
jgi:hypothetical protein